MGPDANPGFFKIFSPDLYAQIGMLVVFVGVIFGKDFIKRFLWNNDANDRRKESFVPDYFEEMMTLHREFLESNKLVFSEIRNAAKNWETMGESLIKISHRAFEEHEEIRKTGIDILREIKHLREEQNGFRR